MNKNTEKCNQHAARLFRSTMTKINFFSDEQLQTFYFNARTQKGYSYKASTMENFWLGLNRYLKAPPYNGQVDLKSELKFSKSNECYKAALRELQVLGTGSTDHYLRIVDLVIIYNSALLNNSTPTGLLNKFQFDVRFSFERRGCKNIHTMTKSTYEVITDGDTGKRYFAQRIDESNKNHIEKAIRDIHVVCRNFQTIQNALFHLLQRR